MENLEKLLINGFVISASNGKFIIKKDAVPCNPIVVDEVICDSYSDAIVKGMEILNTPKICEWYAIARYNRGLGIEYKNIFDIYAENFELAKKKAEEMALNVLDENAVVLEIKVRPK